MKSKSVKESDIEKSLKKIRKEESEATSRAKEYLPTFLKNLFDKDTIKSEKEAMEALSEFYSTPKAVLVGTELALYYMEEKVETAAIISFDSLFSLPTFRINERIVHILEALRDLADKQFIIQTKNPDEKILLAFKNSTLLGFYRDEISERKMLSYPPFSVLIKISYQGTYENSEKAKSYLQETFKDYKPDIMDAFIKRIKGMYIMHALIRIPSKNWTRQGLSMDGSFDHKLENLLKSLPPSFKVQVDQENIL
jgi:primosomal protein N' (replication factor Y)